MSNLLKMIYFFQHFSYYVSNRNDKYLLKLSKFCNDNICDKTKKKMDNPFEDFTENDFCN